MERKFSDTSKYSVVLGTMKNSFNDRCLAAGVRRDWAGWNNGWVFKGIYGYVGEFFFDTFDDCGDHGSYHDFKKVTGIGFSPYIYHGFQYNFTSYFGMDVGIIIPSVFVITAQWSFREGANKQVISSQADSLIKISRIWADFFPANTSNQPI